jgi:hypothetical protein
VLFVFLGFYSCSESDDGEAGLPDFSNRQSSCENVVGWTGAFWDSANGIAVPLNGPLVLQNSGGTTGHPLPLLNIRIPAGYTGGEAIEPSIQAVGIDVVRNDGQAIYRWIPSSFVLQQVPSLDILSWQINKVFANFNFNGNFEVLCSSFRQQVFEGIPLEYNGRLIRFDGRLLQVYVITTYVAGGTAITISMVTAPEAEYENEIVNSWWPMNFEMFVRDDGNIVDQDGDGFTVLEDPDDTDPNVPVNQG